MARVRRAWKWTQQRARAVAAWVVEKKLGRDALVAVGVLALATGAEQLTPGTGRLVFGGLVLYVALFHGPIVARILRPPQRGE